ncbi:L-threonylcarbamoyladenylate synthase [Hathewaya proteolytica DSM 3090]|uniref:Threonylcarbamoyl-AMP synthase n=1 Tax=Hathewaya proteolytica DSM 3090 TaxID=1121331 RepID=A0A1M6S8S4_9CLOT|nr:L-threonylcarbamoyladenylate synthase [Hathewaya proteolytica]SHK41133.1 L-threonylcarbamoyladenylate synthase [Hathewaya proteolytica DSM 3090]
METKVVIMKEEDIQEDDLKEAAQYIKNGEIVAFPTETVYGLGANALDEKAVSKIFEAKGRPQDNPLIIHVCDKNITPYVRDISEKAERLMELFWPGPLTLLFYKKDIIPYKTSAGLSTVGVRMPDNKIALKLIEQSGVPIAAPSANLSGRPSTTNVHHCIEDLSGKIPYIIGSEESRVGVESTIVDCTGQTLCVLRPGGITLEQLRMVDSNVYIDPAILKKEEADLKPKAPGMKYRHYAPKSPLKIVKGDVQRTITQINHMIQQYKLQGKLVGVLATEETKNSYIDAEVIFSVGSREKIEEIAYNLFDALRKFDSTDVDVIISEAFEEENIGVAIMNRLKKSAGFNIIEV